MKKTKNESGTERKKSGCEFFQQEMTLLEFVETRNLMLKFFNSIKDFQVKWDLRINVVKPFLEIWKDYELATNQEIKRLGTQTEDGGYQVKQENIKAYHQFLAKLNSTVILITLPRIPIGSTNKEFTVVEMAMLDKYLRE